LEVWCLSARTCGNKHASNITKYSMLNQSINKKKIILPWNY
jgi:hypothetical protein